MKENKIDKLFKAKASQGNFPYSESYWADAEKLLDSQKPIIGGGISKGIWAGAMLLLVGTISVVTYLAWPSQTENETLTPSHEMVVSPENEVQNAPSNSEEIKSDITPIIEQDELNSESKTVSTQKANKSSETRPLAGDAQLGNEQNIAQSPAKASTTETGNAEITLDSKEDASDLAAAPAENWDENEGAVEPSENAPIAMGGNSTTNSETNNGAESLPALASETGSAETENTGKPAEANSTENTNNDLSGNENTAVTSSETGSEMPDDKPEDINPDYGVKKPFSKLDNFNVALGASYTMLFAHRSLTLPQSAQQDFRQANESVRNITSYGLDVQIGYKNWIFNTGVFKTQYEENINYSTTVMGEILVDNGQWNSFDVWNYQVDSTWQVDSIYSGSWRTDTTWSVYTDSTYSPQWDTTIGEKESPELARNNGVRSISYVEVPLWFGRSFGKNKFTFDVQAGFAIGFLTSVKGSYYINPQTDGLEEMRIEQHQQMMYNAMFRTGIRYQISPKLNAGVFPTLRYNLNSALKGDGMNQRYFGYGLTLGLYYQF